MSDPYRDETEMLRRRVETLEEELRDARATIERLEGGSPGEGGLGSAIVGGPTHVEIDQTLDRELGSDEHEEILDIARRRFGGMGQPTVVGKSFHLSVMSPQMQRMVEITARAKDGRTELRVSERFSALIGGMFGGIVGGAGGGGLGVIIPLAILAGLGALVPLVALLWIALVFVLTRMAYRSAARKRARDLRAMTDEIVSACSNGRAARPPRLRVASGHERGSRAGEAEAESESEAESEAASEAASTARSPRRA